MLASTPYLYLHIPTHQHTEPTHSYSWLLNTHTFLYMSIHGYFSLYIHTHIYTPHHYKPPHLHTNLHTPIPYPSTSTPTYIPTPTLPHRSTHTATHTCTLTEDIYRHLHILTIQLYTYLDTPTYIDLYTHLHTYRHLAYSHARAHKDTF